MLLSLQLLKLLLSLLSKALLCRIKPSLNSFKPERVSALSLMSLSKLLLKLKLCCRVLSKQLSKLLCKRLLCELLWLLSKRLLSKLMICLLLSLQSLKLLLGLLKLQCCLLSLHCCLLLLKLLSL